MKLAQSTKKPKCLFNKNHKVYFNEKENDWVCKGHEKLLLDEGYPSDVASGNCLVKDLNRTFHLNNIEYKKEAKPLDQRKKIGNVELRDTFDKLEGRKLKVSVLKQLFENKIKINEKDTTTTVISSAIM